MQLLIMSANARPVQRHFSDCISTQPALNYLITIPVPNFTTRRINFNKTLIVQTLISQMFDYPSAKLIKAFPQLVYALLE